MLVVVFTILFCIVIIHKLTVTNYILMKGNIMSKTVKATFVKERECKHSVRYKPICDIGRSITAVLYLMNTVLEELGRPESIELTIEGKE